MPTKALHNHGTTTTATSLALTKPPSVLRYTFILLKDRPSATDIETLSLFFTSRNPGLTTPLRLPRSTYRLDQEDNHALTEFGFEYEFEGEDEDKTKPSPSPPYCP
jgi:hypothetical protein